MREFIRDNGERGRCAWCGSRNRFLIPLTKLGNIFRDVTVIYDEVEFGHGDQISFLLQEDWSVFSEAISEASDGRMQDLCVAILEAGLHPKDDVDEPDYRGSFHHEESWLEENWSSQLEAMLTGKRLRRDVGVPFDAEEDDGGLPPLPDSVEFAYEELVDVYEEGRTFYRARIHEDRSRKDRFGATDLGAPPPDKTPDGRANRAGEPVLYLASDENTALAEKRPWRGAAVAVAKMKLRERSRVINLLNLKIPTSPFFEEHLAWELQLSGLFHRLSEELSRPIMPNETPRLYVPTQHLCDLIRRAGYDGVAYPSAMGPGSNVVLFDPTAAEAIDLVYVRVGLVRLDYEEILPTHEVYEEGHFDYLLAETDSE